MHTQEMEKIETGVRVLKGLIEDYEERWEQHGRTCNFYSPSTDGCGGCLHNDPDYEPICEPGNCPLLK